MTEWRAIPSYEGFYEVSDDGRVRSIDRVIEQDSRWGNRVKQRYGGRVLKQATNRYGYLTVFLQRKGVRFFRTVHQLVLEAFSGPCPDGMECRHLDGSRTSNGIENLEWCSHAKNQRDMILHGTVACGERHPNAKLTEADVRQIFRLIFKGETQQAIADQFGVRQNTISRIAAGKSRRITTGWTEVRK